MQRRNLIKMKVVLISILVTLFFSCKAIAPDSQILDFGSFKLKTPGNWYKFELRGIDSYIGGLTNGKDTLRFDYGWYSAHVGDEDPTKHKFAEDTINGLKANLVIPIVPGDGYTRMFIQVDKQNSFSIGGQDIHGTDTILKIFKSVVFEESDTTINSVLTISKFKQDSHRVGIILFRENCGACHSLSTFSEGPTVQTLIRDRDIDWLFKFFSKRDLVAKDSIHLKLKEGFDNLECPTFPNLTKEDIIAIKNYIMSIEGINK